MRACEERETKSDSESSRAAASWLVSFASLTLSSRSRLRRLYCVYTRLYEHGSRNTRFPFPRPPAIVSATVSVDGHIRFSTHRPSTYGFIKPYDHSTRDSSMGGHSHRGPVGLWVCVLGKKTCWQSYLPTIAPKLDTVYTIQQRAEYRQGRCTRG